MGHLFCEKIPLFLTLTWNIYLKEFNRLVNCTVPEIFNDFKDVQYNYIHCGFRITTLHADGEYGTLNILIESIPGGPLVNLDAEN